MLRQLCAASLPSLLARIVFYDKMDHNSRIIKAKSISDVFEIVKEIVYEYLGADQAGLMVGVTDLGSYQNGFCLDYP